MPNYGNQLDVIYSISPHNQSDHSGQGPSQQLQNNNGWDDNASAYDTGQDQWATPQQSHWGATSQQQPIHSNHEWASSMSQSNTQWVTLAQQDDFPPWWNTPSLHANVHGHWEPNSQDQNSHNSWTPPNNPQQEQNWTALSSQFDSHGYSLSASDSCSSVATSTLAEEEEEQMNEKDWLEKELEEYGSMDALVEKWVEEFKLEEIMWGDGKLEEEGKSN